MARQQDTASRATRLSGTLTVGLLSAATSLAFGRVFVGRGPTLKLMAAGLVSVAIAALLERRSLLLATLASAIALVWAIGIVVFAHTLWYGLPSQETLSAIGHALGRVGQQARVQVAPTPPLAPLFLAALTAVWTASFSAHALAVRAGSPLLAILPPVALVGFADTVLEDGARPVYAVTFLVAALAVVFVDGLRRIRQWGPLWAVHRRARHATTTMTRGARSVALIAVGAAVLLPGVLPGFRSDPLVDFSTSADNGVHIDPFVSIKAQLERQKPLDLFQVTSPSGRAYWRLYALDLFDGTRWSSSDPTLRGAPDFPTPAQLPLPTQEQPPSNSATLQQRYRILTDLPDAILPMAYPATSVTLAGGGLVRYDEDLAKAGIVEPLDADYEYTVSSRVVAPTPEQLDAVTFQQPSAYGKYTYVPPNVSPQVETIAQQWAGDGSPYRQVLAIMNRFRRAPFSYSLNVDVSSSSDALLDFLTKTHRGFCQQFATAMAIMVRELGLPARVAVGFQPGEQHGDVYTVSTEDAHSWVEVLFPGYGWLPFEPTPGRTNPVALPGSYLLPSSPTGDSTSTGQGQQGNLGGGQGSSCGTGPGAPPGQLCNADPLLSGRGGRGGRGALTGGPGAPIPVADTGGYHVPYRLILLGLLGVLLALAILVPAAKTLWRRRAIRGAKDPRALVLAAYRVFDGEAADVGLGRADGETLEEYRVRLANAVSFSDGHLSALTAATIRAAYSRVGPGADEARDATRAARVAIKDVRREVGVLRRITGTYRPGW